MGMVPFHNIIAAGKYVSHHVGCISKFFAHIFDSKVIETNTKFGMPKNIAVGWCFDIPGVILKYIAFVAAIFADIAFRNFKARLHGVGALLVGHEHFHQCCFAAAYWANYHNAFFERVITA